MANDLIPPPDRFANAVARARAARAPAAAAPAQGSKEKPPRARLNVFPDDVTIADMVGRALGSLKRGIVWARGAIVNLVV